MPNYQYIATTTDGKRVKGQRSATSQAELLEILRTEGQYCLSVEEVIDKTQVQKGKSMKTKELSVFFRQLSTMLKAGIPIVNALQIISTQTEGVVKEVILRVYGSVQEGTSMADSMKKVGGKFPAFAINMVQTGEMSGSLDNVVEKLAEYYEKEMKTKNKVKQAMMYPLILGILTVVVVFVLLTFVVPTITKQFTSAGADLPTTTKILIGVSDFAKTKWYIILIVCVVIYIIWTTLMKSKQIKMSWDKLLFSIPVFGKLYLTIVSSNFARCLYALFSGGTSLITSIEMAAKVVGNTYAEKLLLDAKDEISKGKSMSDALKAMNLFPSMMLSLFTIGEQSGSLDQMILRTADIYEEESDNAITRMVGLLEPLMIVIMALIIGFVVVAVIQCIYGSMGTIL